MAARQENVEQLEGRSVYDPLQTCLCSVAGALLGIRFGRMQKSLRPVVVFSGASAILDFHAQWGVILGRRMKLLEAQKAAATESSLMQTGTDSESKLP